jgi:glycoside/pentoside/hexuronide:cation symporter, GPH family
MATQEMTVQTQSKPSRENWIVPVREKLSYFVGAGSNFTVHSFVSSFFAAYLLMIGISPTISATVLLFIKAWDAINDVLFGYFIDRVRFKPQQGKILGWLFSGRYLPWFRIAAFIFPFSAIIMFTVNTAAPLWLRITQYVIGYLLYDTAFTLANAPFGCMLTSLTNNADERTFLQSYSVLGQGIGSLPVMFIGTALIAGGFGYSGSAIVFGILGFLIALPLMLGVKERNISEPAQAAEQQYPLKEMFTFLTKTKEFLFFELGQIIWGMFYTSAFGIFVAYYLLGDAKISLIGLAAGVIPTIALIPFFPVIFKRVNKITAIRVACGLFFFSALAIWLMKPEGVKAAFGLWVALSAVCGSSNAFVMIGSAMLLPDIAELAKYRTRAEHVGIIFSIHSFVTKLVASLVTSVSLLILGAYGYISVQANSFEELAAMNAKGVGLQTAHALEGLWNVSYLFPAVGFGLAVLFFMLVKLNRHQVNIMIKANLGEITREEAETQLANAA